MSEFLMLIFGIMVVLTAAKLGGYISVRLGQPSVLGELMAGLVLGPTVLNMLHTWPVFAESHTINLDGHEVLLIDESLRHLAEFGVLLLMMLAGLELHLSELLKSGKVASISGTLGVVIPVLLGFGTAVAFGASRNEAIFIGLALSATSVSVSAQTLMELKMLRSRVGLSMLGAAVFDDILVILLLSIASIALVGEGGGIDTIGLTILRMIGYLVITSLVGAFILPKLAVKISELRINQGLLTFSLVTCLFFAWSAEVIGGVAGITGAFLAGLFLARTPFKGDLEQGIAAMAYSLFVPIFFVNIGLGVNLRAIPGNEWIFAIVLTLVAIASKIIGCGFGGRLGGLSIRESLQLGIGMVSRGEVGLIVAAFALAQGVLTQNAFSITVFMVIIATLVTPPLLRASFPKGQNGTKAQKRKVQNV